MMRSGLAFNVKRKMNSMSSATEDDNTQIVEPVTEEDEDDGDGEAVSPDFVVSSA